MRIAFNPSTVAALTSPPNNKDITFDLRGQNIFARGVKFYGTDTNTWRDIKINNVSIGSNILDLRNGSNTTLTNSKGVVTINSTWRPVVDSLTSDSTTSSLSANQGRVLKSLIDGKSDSGHTHDDRYLKLTGGTMLLGEGLRFHSDDNYFGAWEDARIISLLDNNDKICDGGLIIDERATLDGKEYVTELLRIRDSEFKWKGSNILHSGNSYINGSTITLNGSSITVYSSGTADGRYVRKSGDTMSGALNFANNTWNKVGDDVYMGDHNIGGQLCIMGANSTTGLSFHKYGDASIRKSITFDGNTLYMNGSCDYATLSNQTNLLAMNTVPNKTAATSIGSWSPISGRYVFHQKWTDTSTGGDTADFGIYLDGNLTANMVLDGYYNSLLGFRVIGASGGFLKANGTIDNSTYLTSHQSLSNYYTKGEINTKLSGYLPLSGGTMTGQISSNYSVGTWIGGCTNAILKATADGYNSLICAPIKSGNISISAWTAENNLNFGYAKKGKTENSFDTRMYWDAPNNNLHAAAFTGYLYGTADNAVNADTVDGEHASNFSYTHQSSFDFTTIKNGRIVTFDQPDTAYGGINGFASTHGNYLTSVIFNSHRTSNWYVGYIEANTSTGKTQGLQAVRQLAFTNSNVTSATKLQTARKIWGQSFDGTADVNGLLTHVISSDDKFLNVHDNRTSGGYQAIRYFRNGSGVAAIHWFHDKYGGYDWNSNCLNLDPYRGGYVTLGRWDNPDLTVIREGNVGIGTVNPPYKLTIEGVGGNCVPIQLVNASRDGGWVCNAAFFAPNLTSSHNNVITIGKNYSTRNAFGLTHVHIGDGSASNYAALEVWGIGNVQRWYYDRHSAFLHRTDFASLDSSASYMSSALQIREHGYGGTQAETWANAPRMSWHWSGRVQTQIGLASNNELYLSKNNFGNAYRLMYETGTWSINISGNANNATNADKLDGYHYNSFAPFNGVKFGHGPDANTWHRILQFTTNWIGQVTFMYSPEECQRSYWGMFNINIRSKDIWFRGFSFADLPQIKCCGDDDNNWSVWIKGSTNNYDPYGVIQVLNFSNASIVSVGLDKSQTTEPSGTYNKAPDLFQAGSVNWSDITNKIVAGNEFNVVNAGYNNMFWFNYLPINDRNNKATISTYCMGNGQQGYASVTASGFIKNGGNENQLLRADGGVAAFNWAGQSGQPTWLWGGNNFNSYYVYNPSNFRVAYAASAGNAEKLGGMSKNYGQSPFGTIPCIGGDGVMEIGKYIDFHNDNSGKHDFSTRLQTTGNYANVVNLPSASGTLALTSQVLTWKSQIIDMRNYSESYWHPVTVPLPNAGYNKIKVSVQLNSGDKPSWATHDSGITCNMEIWATSSGWGTTDSDTICLNYTYKFCSQNPCGWMQLTSPSLGVVFLRGGSRYTVYTDFDAVFTPHNQKYTWSSGSSSQDTGGPYTSCPGLNFNMGTIRTDLIATLVQARRVCAGHDPGIDNSISCSNWFRSSGNTGWYNSTYEGGWYMSDNSWIRAHNNVGIYTGGQIYSSSSIRMGDIYLENTNEINSAGILYLNRKNSANINLCGIGGSVGIGQMVIDTNYKLDVNGSIRATGFHCKYHDSNDAILLAGGGYMIPKTGTTAQSTAIQFGKYVWIMLNTNKAGKIVPNNISNPPNTIYIEIGDSKWRISPDGNIHFQSGSISSLSTTICYVAS